MQHSQNWSEVVYWDVACKHDYLSLCIKNISIVVVIAFYYV